MSFEWPPPVTEFLASASRLLNLAATPKVWKAQLKMPVVPIRLINALNVPNYHERFV